MSDTTNRELSELSRLIAAEKAAARMPGSARARVWGGIEASLLAPPLPGHGVHRLGRALRRVALSRGTTALLSLAIGGASGVALQAHRDRVALRSAPLLSAPVAAPSAPSAAPLPQVLAPAPPPSVAPAAPASTAAIPKPSVRHRSEHPQPTLAPPLPPPAPVATARVPEVASTLEQERNVIDTARMALSRGDSQGALQLLDKHASEYPAGAFAEEGGALRIQALFAGGDEAQARQALIAFRAKYPRSLLLPAIEQSLNPTP